MSLTSSLPSSFTSLVLSFWSDCLIHMFSLLKHLLVSRKLIGGGRDAVRVGMRERALVRTPMGLYNTSINSTNWQTKNQTKTKKGCLFLNTNIPVGRLPLSRTCLPPSPHQVWGYRCTGKSWSGTILPLLLATTPCCWHWLEDCQSLKRKTHQKDHKAI